jgi:hypothetical protein
VIVDIDSPEFKEAVGVIAHTFESCVAADITEAAKKLTQAELEKFATNCIHYAGSGEQHDRAHRVLSLVRLSRVLALGYALHRLEMQVGTESTKRDAKRVARILKGRP